MSDQENLPQPRIRTRVPVEREVSDNPPGIKTTLSVDWGEHLAGRHIQSRRCVGSDKATGQFLYEVWNAKGDGTFVKEAKALNHEDAEATKPDPSVLWPNVPATRERKRVKR